MAEYIKREAADKALTISAANDKDKNRRIWAKAICVLHDLPAADVAPVVHGLRADTESFGGHGFNYWPNCGARMDGKDGEEIE